MPPNSPKKMKQRATRLDPQNALFSRFLIGVRYQPFCPYVPCGRRGGQGPASSGGGARCCRRRRSRKCRRCRLGCRRRQRSIASRGPPAGRSRRHGHGAAQGRSGSRSCRDGEGRRREHGCGERGGRGRRRSFFFFFFFFFFLFFALTWLYLEQLFSISLSQPPPSSLLLRLGAPLSPILKTTQLPAWS